MHGKKAHSMCQKEKMIKIINSKHYNIEITELSIKTTCLHKQKK